MPVSHITGSYRVVGSSPDGDSVRFYPDDPQAFADAGLVARVNAAGGAQLRLDGIDALETHYTPPGGRGVWRQPAGLAGAAADALLERLGFTGIERVPDGTVTTASPARSRGYVLTRFADTYGRPVAVAYAGDRVGPAADGGLVFLGPEELARSVNFALLAAGLVYPTFYSRLFVNLRGALAAAALAARQDRAGVWAQDATLPGFTLRSREQRQQELVILPKLFRRLVEYLALDDTGGVSLARFEQFLAGRDDRLFTVPAGQATGLDTLVDVDGQHVRLTVPPEQIVFLER